MKPIGPEIKGIRTMKNLTIEEVAETAQISTEELELIENNPEPSKEDIKKVCDAINIPVAFLMFFVLEASDCKKPELFNALQGSINDVLIETIQNNS